MYTHTPYILIPKNQYTFKLTLPSPLPPTKPRSFLIRKKHIIDSLVAVVIPLGLSSHHTQTRYTGIPASVIARPTTNSKVAEIMEVMTKTTAHSVNKMGRIRGT